MDKSTESAFITSYPNKALDTFVRGLNGDLPRLLAVREPKDLPEALSLCTKLANQDYRTRYAYNTRRPQEPPIPPRNFTQINNRQQNIPKQFFPQLTHFAIQNQQLNRTPQSMQRQQYQPFFSTQPTYNQIQQSYQPFSSTQPTYNQNQQNYQPFLAQPNQQSTYQRQYIPPQHITPKPQPPPEPMDIDRSIRSQLVDCANRLKQQYNKRPNMSQQSHYQQPKQARKFHINTNEWQNGTYEYIQENSNTPQEYINTSQQYNNTSEEQIDQYSEQNIETGNNNYVDIADIHFLD